MTCYELSEYIRNTPGIFFLNCTKRKTRFGFDAVVNIAKEGDNGVPMPESFVFEFKSERLAKIFCEIVTGFWQEWQILREKQTVIAVSENVTDILSE